MRLSFLIAFILSLSSHPAYATDPIIVRKVFQETSAAFLYVRLINQFLLLREQDNGLVPDEEAAAALEEVREEYTRTVHSAKSLADRGYDLKQFLGFASEKMKPFLTEKEKALIDRVYRAYFDNFAYYREYTAEQVEEMRQSATRELSAVFNRFARGQEKISLADMEALLTKIAVFEGVFFYVDQQDFTQNRSAAEKFAGWWRTKTGERTTGGTLLTIASYIGTLTYVVGLGVAVMIGTGWRSDGAVFGIVMSSLVWGIGSAFGITYAFDSILALANTAEMDRLKKAHQRILIRTRRAVKEIITEVKNKLASQDQTSHPNGQKFLSVLDAMASECGPYGLISELGARNAIALDSLGHSMGQ